MVRLLAVWRCRVPAAVRLDSPWRRLCMGLMWERLEQRLPVASTGGAAEAQRGCRVIL